MFGLSKKERFEREKDRLWEERKRVEKKIQEDEEKIKNDPSLYKFQKQKKIANMQVRKQWNTEHYYKQVDEAKEKYGIKGSNDK